MEQYNELKRLIISIEDDANKFYVKNNKAAGLRLRKGLNDVKTFANTMRKQSLLIDKQL